MPSTSAKERCLNLLKYSRDDLSIDSPETTIRRWQIIREKPFLSRIYTEWYKAIASSIPSGSLPVLEIGSGAGFLSDHVEGLITSDILDLPQVNQTVDACKTLPFSDQSLRGITMINTLHHLPDVTRFFEEASRCLTPGGSVAMIEPWATNWSCFVYTKLHHEPFLPKAESWQFETSGPLSGANGALPWILFSRDQQRFSELFPNLIITKIELMMPIRYLLSGGVSMHCIVPNWTYLLWKCAEDILSPLMPQLAMFALIVLTRRA